jgi:hypothetical protein
MSCLLFCRRFLPAPRSFHRLGGFNARRQDFIDAEGGEKLAMAFLAAVTDFGFVFKDDYLIATAVLLSRRQYPGTFYPWLTNGDISAVNEKQHFVQLDRFTLSHDKTVDINSLAFDHPILFATGLNNSVNFKPPD